MLYLNGAETWTLIKIH